MKKSKTKKSRTLFEAMLLPLAITMVIQSILFSLVVSYGGVKDSLNQNAKDIMIKQLVNQRNEFSNDLHSLWTDFTYTKAGLDEKFKEFEKEKGKFPFYENQENTTEFLKETSEIIIHTLRSNSVNGVFLILNDEKGKTSLKEKGSESKAGFCIRDLDAESNYTGYEDLLIGVSPLGLANSLNCPLDYMWEPKYFFTAENERYADFYYKPINAVWDNPDISSEYLTYFEGKEIEKYNDSIIYTIPLISESGYPYGVLGVEINRNQLMSLMPANTLGKIGDSSYVLAFHDEIDGKISPIASTGALFEHSFGKDTVLNCGHESHRNLDIRDFETVGRANDKIYVALEYIDVYEANSPFFEEQLVLMAMQSQDELLNTAKIFRNI